MWFSYIHIIEQIKNESELLLKGIINPEELKEKVLNILETVCDPEVPVLSVIDLGIIWSVEIKDGIAIIQITPTYTGCPAMQFIEMNIKSALDSEGIKNKIETILSPAWTTDWMSEEGKRKLKEYGIAPPMQYAKVLSGYFHEEETVPCPRCNSNHTEKISEFGSTACKALFRCIVCKEPFDYFKCH
jgi:ring-1,2-phenylacetyl-CoA epoxidase subunit PaaD